MIRYFLNEQSQITTKHRKLIHKIFIKKRKYNPFHLECQHTKKKLCYCKKNPITLISDAQKSYLWTKDYLSVDLYFDKEAQEMLKETSQSFYKGDDEQKKKKAMETVMEQSGESFNRSLDKIKNMNREECINFLKSIKQTQKTSNILSQPEGQI